MNKRILIGVGGSGQHVVHAYLRFLTLTFPQAAAVPHIYIVDADAREGRGDDKRSTLIDDIFELHSFLTKGDATPSRCQIIKPYRMTPGQAAAPVLGDLIGVNGNPALASLAHAFLADDNNDLGNDWTVDLSKGMMANPKVGSIAMAHKLESMGRTENGVPQDLNHQFGDLFTTLPAGARVAIVGSNFGGTGSGVIPALVRHLDKVSNVDAVRAFMCLPWFSIDHTENSDRTSAARDRDGVNPRARNSSLGLHTYFDEIRGLNTVNQPQLQKSTYVLCQTMLGWPQEKRLDDGNYDQRENRHVLNLIQANAIQAFLGMGPNGAPNGHLYAVKTSDETENSGRFNAQKSPHLRFRAGQDDSRQLSDLLADAEAVAFVLEKGGRTLAAADKGNLGLKGVVDKLKNQQGIEKFVMSLAQALDKAPVTHGLLFKHTTAPDEVFHELGKALIEQAHQVRTSLVWMDGHSTQRAGADKDRVAGITDIHVGHLFSAPRFGDHTQEFKDLDVNDLVIRPWNNLGLEVKNLTGDNLEKSPAISQAFATFNSIFEMTPKGTENAASVDALISRFSELTKQAPSEAKTSIAAFVIAESLHRRVFAARDTVRQKDNAADERQKSADVGENAGQSMLSLRGVTGTPVSDCRLAAVDLAENAIGKVGEFEEAHPLSLAYLDPFAGIHPGNAAQIDLGEFLLLEHGLRGIPNVAAPYLTQKWRLEKCRPRSGEDLTAAAYTIVGGQMQATKAGIYLHARRVVEAAFWLMITADHRVEFVPDLFAASADGNDFIRLLRRELNLARDGRLSALVFAKGSRHAGKPIFLWNGDYWYLAANTAARKFFAALIAELPTVRNCYSSSNPMQRSGSRPAARPLEQYFAFQLENLINLIIDAVQPQNAEDLPNVAGLIAVLRDILAELPAPSSDANLFDNGPAHALLLNVANKPTAYFSVATHKVLGELRSYLCPQTVIFVDHLERPNGLLPFKAGIWEMLEGGVAKNYLELGLGKSAKIDERSLAKRQIKALHLNVKGLGELTLEQPFGDEAFPTVNAEIEWAFSLWPNLKAKGWNYYVASGNGRIGDPDFDPARKAKSRAIKCEWANENLPLQLRVLGYKRSEFPAESATPTLAALTTIINGLPQRLDGVPVVFELVVGTHSLGSRPVELAEVRGEKVVHSLGLDFGTSSTCAAIQITADDPSTRHSVPLLPYNNSSFLPEVNQVLYFDSTAKPETEKFFFETEPVFYRLKSDVERGTESNQLGSDMFVALTDVHKVLERQKGLLSESYGIASKPLADINLRELAELEGYPLAAPLFSALPVHPRVTSSGESPDHDFYYWLGALFKVGGKRIYSNLKWARTEDTSGVDQSRCLRALYLEQVLAVVLASLRYQGFNRIDHLVATQPEALAHIRNNFAELFDQDLQDVFSNLCRRTGFNWGDAEPRMVSETVAALYVVHSYDPGSTKSVVTIDVGGGTTDVGICLRFGAKLSRQEKYTSSVRFAGNNLLTALANLEEVRKAFAQSTEFNPEVSEDLYITLTKADLRRNKRGAIQSEKTGFLTDLFFDGIMEYAFNLFNSFAATHPDWLQQFEQDPAQTLEVVMFGNGFKLYDAFQPAGKTRTLQNYLAKLPQRLVAAKLIAPSVAARLKFTEYAAGENASLTDPKTDLVRQGALNASQNNDLFAQSQRDVLLPKGVYVRRDDKPIRADNHKLLKLEEFAELWLGHERGSTNNRWKIALDLELCDLESHFPLTQVYWSPYGPSKVDKSQELQNVFQPSDIYADRYRNVPGLYLTGLPLGNARSYAWLLKEHAKGLN